MRRLTAALLLAASGSFGCWGTSPSDSPQAASTEKKADPAAKARPLAKEKQPNVIFIVLDTVRADHLSACGYERPTSPYLEVLSTQANVAFTCNGVSPATWTVPSHASFFTGLTVPEHHSDAMGKPMASEHKVLSEQFKERGYSTVMVSANPTLNKDSGLQRGFDHLRVAKNLKRLRGEGVIKQLKSVMKEVPKKAPLFLFVNLIDAHDPYPEIPEDLPWVPPQPEVPFNVHDPEQAQPYHRFILGQMDESEAEAYKTSVLNGYDYGVRQADDTLRLLLETLDANGTLKGDFRLIITSDHGEFLGEHGLLRHGCYTWEPVISVPFLYLDSARRSPLPLPEPLSTVNAYQLALEGRIDAPAAPLSFSKRRKKDIKVGADMVALRKSADAKWVWREGDLLQFDLAADPGELRPLPLAPADGDLSELTAAGDAHAAHLALDRSVDADPEMLQALEALGYVE